MHNTSTDRRARGPHSLAPSNGCQKSNQAPCGVCVCVSSGFAEVSVVCATLLGTRDVLCVVNIWQKKKQNG